MSAQWFKKEMTQGSLLVRVLLDFSSGTNAGALQNPIARIDMCTGFNEDEIVWGWVRYRYDSLSGPRLSEARIFPVMQTPEKCWEEVRVQWRAQPGWLQHKAVVCRMLLFETAINDLNFGLSASHLLVLQHLARAEALFVDRETEDFGLYRHLATRTRGLISAQNRVWAAMAGLPA